MEKKEMKWYEAPKMELVNVELQGMLCGSPTGGGSANIGEDDIEDGFILP